ncbi:MAG: protein kinase domain-containing protein [Nitrospirota bacterium]
MTTPERFGPYHLLKKIGRGGMAELYLARQTGVAGFERVVAIKRILPHLTEDREFVQMFVNEAKLAAQITHPNVVQIYDFGAVLGTYYIAMEYVMGKSLAAVLAQSHKLGKPVPVSAAAYVTARIAAGLDHAYRGATASGAALGIIHRDISPQNILIGYNGDVKLVDFGIAKAGSSSTHTQTGVLKGKLAYLSPEQAWGKTIDHRSDLFALGIVLHEMLTGQRLFKAENEFSTLERVRTADVTPPSRVNTQVPPELDAVVLKALAKQPDDRYPHGQAFEDALQNYLRRLAAPPSARELAEYVRTLFEKDIETDTAAYQQVTTVTKTTATPTVKRPTPETPAEPARAMPKPQPVSAPVPPPKPAGRGRQAVIGLGVVALIALTAVGAWSLKRPSTVEPTAAPAALAPEPIAQPIVEPPAQSVATTAPLIEEPPINATADEPSVDLVTTPPEPDVPATETVSPAPAKRPKRVRDIVRAKAAARDVPVTTREAAATTPTVPRPAAATSSTPSTTSRPVASAPKPVLQAKPIPTAPPVPARVTPPTTTASPVTPPIHEDAPLPLLP